MISMNAAQLPTIDALLLSQLSPKTIYAVEEFIDNYHLKMVLIRSERPTGGVGFPSRQAVPSDNLFEKVSEILEPGKDVIIAIQAAGNIYQNLYNLNIELNPFLPNKIIIEIAGPGFTATDLNRSGSLHERIEIPSYAIELTESLVKRDYLVGNDIYERQRNRKLEVLDRDILNTEKALILEADRYKQIPLPLLQEIWRELYQLRTAVEWLDLVETGCIVSLSYLCEDDLINHYYWDIHKLYKG
jgi:hypothetical protein